MNKIVISCIFVYFPNFNEYVVLFCTIEARKYYSYSNYFCYDDAFLDFCFGHVLELLSLHIDSDEYILRTKYMFKCRAIYV